MKMTSEEGDNKNFIKLGMAIIDVLTQILRVILSNNINYKKLHSRVQEKQRELNLRAEQRKLIENSKTTGYMKFDITLLYNLIRNLCHKIHPTHGWADKEERMGPEDTTLGDDIERIRLLRNKVYGHISTTVISDEDFKTYWSDIRDICKRMDKGIGGNYTEKLSRIENRTSDTIDEETEQRYMSMIKKEFQEMEKDVADLRDMFYEWKNHIKNLSLPFQILGVSGIVILFRQQGDALILHMLIVVCVGFTGKPNNLEHIKDVMNDLRMKYMYQDLENKFERHDLKQKIESREKLFNQADMTAEMNRQMQELVSDHRKKTNILIKTTTAELSQRYEQISLQLKELNEKYEKRLADIDNTLNQIQTGYASVNADLRKEKDDILHKHVSDSGRVDILEKQRDHIKVSVDELSQKYDNTLTAIKDKTEKAALLENLVKESNDTNEKRFVNIESTLNQIQNGYASVNADLRKEKDEILQKHSSDSSRLDILEKGKENITIAVDELSQKYDNILTANKDSKERTERIEHLLKETSNISEHRFTVTDEALSRIQSGYEIAIVDLKRQKDEVLKIKDEMHRDLIVMGCLLLSVVALIVLSCWFVINEKFSSKPNSQHDVTNKQRNIENDYKKGI